MCDGSNGGSSEDPMKRELGAKDIAGGGCATESYDHDPPEGGTTNTRGSGNFVRVVITA
jgi:hypothetical protein